jgi:AraC family transcriptional regulator of adaptative response/methylated-DNA-[protein]-cysteine methyltransferase
MFNADHALIKYHDITARKIKRATITLHYGFHRTPFGPVFAAVYDNSLCALGFVDDHNDKNVDERARLWPHSHFISAPEQSKAFVADVFSPEPRRFALTLFGTPFQLRVWQALMNVPAHRRSSYGALASAIGQPAAARAVGKALGHNPLAVVVPCHRIVSSQGQLTGYHWGLERKKALLDWEQSITSARPAQ